MNSKHPLYFPLFVDLSDKKVVVVGAGTIAKRRIRTLVDFTDRLVVVAPEVNPELKALEAAGRLTILKHRYRKEDIGDAFMVIAAARDKKINQEIYTDCKSLGVLVNVCTDKDRCDFYFPSIIVEDHLVVGVSGSGQEAKRAREVSREIEELLIGYGSASHVTPQLPKTEKKSMGPETSGASPTGENVR